MIELESKSFPSTLFPYCANAQQLNLVLYAFLSVEPAHHWLNRTATGADTLPGDSDPRLAALGGTFQGILKRVEKLREVF